jgi:hypothetical protein
VTDDEAYKLIDESTPYQASGEEMAGAMDRWSAANPGELAQWLRYTQKFSAPPVLKTKFGRGITALWENRLAKLSPTPEIARTYFAAKGVFLQYLSAMPSMRLENAGFTHAAVQITSRGADNQATLSNMAEFNRYGAHSIYPGIQTGGWGTHSLNPVQESEFVARRVSEHGLKFYIADTEFHWLNGQPGLTATLLTELRRSDRLGKDFPIAAVSFGYSKFAQGQVQNSNYPAMIRAGVDFIPEAYDEKGYTYGLQAVYDYLVRDGVRPPVLMAVGTYSLPADQPQLQELVSAGKLNGYWVWVAEQVPPGDLALLSEIDV